MIALQYWTRTLTPVWVSCLLACITLTTFTALAKQPQKPQLNPQGEILRDQYASLLDKLSKEIQSNLPTIDSQKKDAFLKARAELASLSPPKENAKPPVVKKYQADKAQAEANSLNTARSILNDTKNLLTSNNLDSKLIKIAILRHGTPAGLAEFAQQSKQHKVLLDKLFADEALMKQMVIAGGANGGV